MLTLGFNCYAHHAAAAIVQDGIVLAAAPEERFSRVKNDGRFPELAIRYCLNHAGASVADLDQVAFHWKPWTGVPQRAWGVLSAGLQGRRVLAEQGGTWRDILLAGHHWRTRFDPGFKRHTPFFRVAHHMSHAAGVFFQSAHPEAAILILDGAGEIASTSMGHGQGNKIRLFQEVHYPHSMGYLFVALTQYLGFRPECDEYKLMSLASYGKPTCVPAFRDLVMPTADGGFRLDLRYFDYHLGGRNPWVSARFVERFGPVRKADEPLDQRHADIALGLQVALEEVALHMVRHLKRVTGARHLCMAGGVALNSVMNARVLRDGPFETVEVQPAANDAGCCIGSALHVQIAQNGIRRPAPPDHYYLGPEYEDSLCRAALEKAGCEFVTLEREKLIQKTASLIADGNVVGWFQGRMEMGPRALGSRSILADPRAADMKDILNARVKHREGFRPFAPAVPEELASQWFEVDRPSPYMLFVVPVRPQKRTLVPAITHVDGTARLQTVSRTSNPLFYDLLHRYGQETGVPVILNTSFNVMGEPIVCTPEDAVRCYLSTGIDALVVGSCLAVKR